MWEAKVIVAAETNSKHKVIPDWGDLIRPLGTNFSEIIIKIHMFSFKKMHLKLSSEKWRPFCLSLNVLTDPNSHPHNDFNSLASGRCGGDFRSVLSENLLQINFKSTSCEIAPRWMTQNAFDDVHIDSINGLMLADNKPLPEPLLTQIYICHHLASLSHNELINKDETQGMAITLAPKKTKVKI